MPGFHGYRIKSTNITEVERILRLAKANLAEASKEEYHRMLSEEIAELIDDITLGIKPRPDIPILDAAVNILNEQVSNAENYGTGTEYDLRSGVTIIPDKGFTYMLLTVSNPALEPAFAGTEGIELYTVGIGMPGDGKVQDAKNKKWERLYKRNEAAPSLLTASLTTMIQVDTSLIVFPDKATRANVRARRNLTSRLLNQYACGREIKSDRLMPLLDRALERILSNETSDTLSQMSDQLMNVLIDIDLELITKGPDTPPKQSFCNTEKSETEGLG